LLILKDVIIKDQKNHILLDKFNYSLGNEDKVGIIGEEGNGKSTLLKAIYNTKQIEDYAEVSGTIITDMKHIGYFEQQLNDKWQESYVYEYVLKNDVADIIEAEDYNRLKEFEQLCHQVHLDATCLTSEQKIKTLSGGEKVKLQLIKLLASHPELLLFDEPTNDLDIETLEWLEQFIVQQTIPVIFISHDETLLEHAANVIIHLEQRNKKTKCVHTIYRGTYQEYVNSRAMKLNKEAALASKEQLEYQKKMIKLNDMRNAVHDALNDTVRNPSMGQLLKKKMKNIKALENRHERDGVHKVDTVEEAIDVYFEATPLPAAKIVMQYQLKELRIQERILLQDVDLLIKGQAKVVITGRNGCGKSLLLKRLYEEIKLRDDLKVGYMPQAYAQCFQEHETPIQFLLEEGDQKDVTRARELLGRMKFTSDEMIHSLMELSEGQKAKVYLLRFIKTNCNVLLLDEPTRNLSPLTNPLLRQILKEFKGCILAVSHDRKFIEEVFTTRYQIVGQRLIRWK